MFACLAPGMMARSEDPLSQYTMKKTYTRKLLFLLALLLAILLAGSAGYHWIEGWSLLDSLFMTVITISTIGYGLPHPLSAAGRVFTIALIIFGTGLAGYGISSLTLMLFQGDLPNYLKRKKMEKSIQRISGHIILCGLSRTGLYTLSEIQRTARQVVVVERDGQALARLGDQEIPHIVGDATDDANLLAAGIERAEAIITCLTSDAENAFVIVTAKSLNPAILTVSKAESENTRKKLISVGCDKVVVPSMLGGLSMANSVVRPETQHFFETLHKRYPDTLQAELLIAGSEWNGRSLREFTDGQTSRTLVIAFEHPGCEVQFDPPGDALLQEGTSLMVIRSC